MNVKTKINSILLFLILLDFVLASVCLISPGLWLKLMHGVEGQDPLGMIRRLGAVWAAFFLFQVIARFRWRQQPVWLLVVAGIRWTEIFSDWVYLYFAGSLTVFGKMGLFVSPPVNILLGWYLWRCFFKFSTRENVHGQQVF